MYLGFKSASASGSLGTFVDRTVLFKHGCDGSLKQHRGGASWQWDPRLEPWNQETRRTRRALEPGEQQSSLFGLHYHR
jgi:hypothetical protein